MGSLVAVALLGSIAVALQRPGKARDVSARLAALGFYLVLVGFFGTQALAAHATASTRGLVAFGFLTAFFGIGLALSVVKTVGAIRGRSSDDVSATN
jgi:hypothetical protein